MEFTTRKYVVLSKFFISFKIELCKLSGYQDMEQYLSTSLLHQSLPVEVFFNRYLLHMKNVGGKAVEELILKYITFSIKNFEGSLLTRAYQFIGEYAVLLFGVTEANKFFQGNDLIVKEIARFKSKKSREMLTQCQILLSSLTLDKQRLDSVLNWLHASCRGHREGMRVKKMLIWTDACRKSIRPFINDQVLTVKESLVLIHLHEELSRLSYALTDGISYGSALNTIINDVSGIPNNVFYKTAITGKVTNYLKHTTIQIAEPTKNTKGLILKGKLFNIILHNGRFHHLSSNHINGLMQAMWEVTGHCYLEKSVHSHIRNVYERGEHKIMPRKEDFIGRLCELNDVSRAQLKMLPPLMKLQKFVSVDTVVDYELSQITGINITTDFLLASLKDVVRHQKRDHSENQ